MLRAHIFGMDGQLTTSEQTESARDECEAALKALGIDAATIVWPDVKVDAATSTEGGEGAPLPSVRAHASAMTGAPSLSDAEWQSLAPLLPDEAPQASTMSNRAFLEAVLAAMQRGGAWTSRAIPTAGIEPVRRRFGRWAHAGVFSTLSDAMPNLDWAQDHKRLLALACARAASLRSRARGRD
jgi:transposase